MHRVRQTETLQRVTLELGVQETRPLPRWSLVGMTTLGAGVLAGITAAILLPPLIVLAAIPLVVGSVITLLSVRSRPIVLRWTPTHLRLPDRRLAWDEVRNIDIIGGPPRVRVRWADGRGAYEEAFGAGLDAEEIRVVHRTLRAAWHRRLATETHGDPDDAETLGEMLDRSRRR